MYGSSLIARYAEIERYKKLSDTLYDSWQDGVINKEEFTRMKIRYNALQEDAEQAVVSLSREIGDIISLGGEKNQWIERFRRHQDFTDITRRMVITLIDSVTVHPGSRLDILFRYRYDYERAVSFALAVSKMYSVPEAELLEEVA